MIVLPWPSPKLSPNARLHWSRKAAATRLARATANGLTLASDARQTVATDGNGPIAMRLTFRAPDKRRRDRTNVEASCKAYFDGIADALRVDDVRFMPTYCWGEPCKGGAVEVTFL